MTRLTRGIVPLVAVGSSAASVLARVRNRDDRDDPLPGCHAPDRGRQLLGRDVLPRKPSTPAASARTARRAAPVR
ncbi:hypothetical protein ACIRVF_15275 [Kitasatospora sp. NPDC101157]|uniref:hypothetical protein n=1 Tax=Kitasatospora sp. NPDC101157 TaxID=3364098 RepID=UPI00381089DE